MSSSRSKVKVLFVDDEAFIVQGLRRNVGDVYDVSTATSGAEGLSLITSGIKFAVIVADMRMPGMNGIEFLVRARALDPDAIFMMLTGNVDQKTALEALEVGQVFHFLTKPCNRDRLLKSIEAAVQLYSLQGDIEKIRTFLRSAA